MYNPRTQSHQFMQKQLTQNPRNQLYQYPPFYQAPFPLETRTMPQQLYNPNPIQNQLNYYNYPQYYPPVDQNYYGQMKENYSFYDQIPIQKLNLHPQLIREPKVLDQLGLQKSVLSQQLNLSQIDKIHVPDDNLQQLVHKLFKNDFKFPLNYSLNNLQFTFNDIKNTLAKSLPKFNKLLNNLSKTCKQTEHVYNYFMIQPDIIPKTLFQGLQHYLQDKLANMTSKVNQKLQQQMKKGLSLTQQPNINEVKSIRRNEVKQQFTFIEHRKQMRKKLLKLSNNIINSFLLQNSTGSQLLIQQFLQICLKIITLFQFLCLDNTSLSPFVSLNSALLFDQITTVRKRLRPFDFLIITNENYEQFEHQMKTGSKQFQQFATRNQNIINQLHQIIVKETQLEGISLINFNELANSVMYREKTKFQTEVLKSYQEIVKEKSNGNENYLQNEALVETGNDLKKSMEKWNKIRNNQLKYQTIFQQILDFTITSESVQKLDTEFEPNVLKISQIEKAINYANKLYNKSHKLVEDVMSYKQDQEDFLKDKYEDILASMHNNLKSKFVYFNVNDQIDSLFKELKALLKYEKMKSKDITHKIEKQLKKGKYKNEFLKQVQHTIELDKMMRSKEEQFIKAQQENFQMQTYWQQQNVQLLQQQQMIQNKRAQELAQNQQTNFALTRVIFILFLFYFQKQLTQLAQERESYMKSNDQKLNTQINQISQNIQYQQEMSQSYQKQVQDMKQTHKIQNDEIKKQLDAQLQEREEQRQKELEIREKERQERKQREEEFEQKRKEEKQKRAEEKAERERKFKEEQEEEEKKLKEKREQREKKEKEEREKKLQEQMEKEEQQRKEKEEKQKEYEEKKRKEKEEKEKKEKERQEKAQKAKEEEQRRLDEARDKREQQKKEKEEKEKKDKEEKEKKYKELKEREDKEKKEREERLKKEKEIKEQKDKEEKEKREKELKEKQSQEQKLKEQREKELKEKKLRDEQEKKEREDRLKKEKEEKDKKEKERKEKEKQEREEKEKKQKEELLKKEKEAQEKKEKEEKLKKEKEEQLKREKELKAQKEKEEKEKKDKEEKEKQEKAKKEKEEREKKEKEAKEKKEQEAKEARQRLENEKLAKQQKEKEEREKKEKAEQEQKEKAEKEKKLKEEQEKKKKEEQEKKLKEEKEKQEKLLQEQKEKEKKLKEEKEKQEKLLQEQKEKEQKKKDQKDSSKKKNKIDDYDDDFNDFDDDIPLPIEESLDNQKQDRFVADMMGSQDLPKQQNKQNRMQAVQDFDDAFDFEDDEDQIKSDFSKPPGQQAQQFQEEDEGEPNFFQPEQLINLQLLELNNVYTQSIGFDQMEKNFEEFNNFESIFLLFEEQIISLNAYLFDYDVGQALEELSNELAILKQSQSEEDALSAIEPKLQSLLQNVQMQYAQITQSPDFSKQSRYFFPFENQLSYFLIEVNPAVGRILIYFSEHLNEEQQLEVAATMDNLISLILYLLEFQELGIMNIEIPDPSKQIFKEFESLPYFQYLLSLYYIIYELDLQTFLACNFTILFDEKIIDRLILAITSTKNLRGLLMDQQGQQSYQMMFEQLIQLYNIETNPEYGTLIKLLELTDPSSLEQMISQEFSEDLQLLRTNKVEHVFLAIDLALETVKQTYYIYIGKTSPEEQELTKKKFTLLFYFYQGYADEINQTIMEMICEAIGINMNAPNIELELQNCEFGLQSFYDQVRHSFAIEFARITLGLWAHLTFSREFGPVNALALISYSQIPYFAEFYMMQGQDQELDEEEMREMMAMQEAQIEAAADAGMKQKKQAVKEAQREAAADAAMKKKKQDQPKKKKIIK